MSFFCYCLLSTSFKKGYKREGNAGGVPEAYVAPCQIKWHLAIRVCATLTVTGHFKQRLGLIGIHHASVPVQTLDPICLLYKFLLWGHQEGSIFTLSAASLPTTPDYP